MDANAALDLSSLTQIRFVFDLVPAGKMRIADFQLTLESDVAQICEAFERSATILDDVSEFAFKRSA